MPFRFAARSSFSLAFSSAVKPFLPFAAAVWSGSRRLGLRLGQRHAAKSDGENCGDQQMGEARHDRLSML